MAERIVKVVKTLRNNWKKTTFFVLLGSYGIYYVRDRIQANKVREEFCKQALVYGEERIGTINKPRKVTIILNPAARKGKAKKLFETNAAPLLHLAGINVEIIKTEFEGHAKDCAAALQTTDAVVVAGGDGTLGEVVTGLLRRSDENAISKKWPIGVIPLGLTNTLAKAMYLDSESEVRWMCNAAMAIIQGITTPVDVMAIQDTNGRSVYGVSQIEWGQFRDTHDQISKYWYLPYIKSRMAYVFSTFKEWPPVFKAHLSYRPPVEVPPDPEVVQTQYSFFSRLFSWIWRTEEKKDVLETEVEEIPWQEVDVSTLEFYAKTNNDDELNASKTTRSMTVRILPDNITPTDFIKEGWRRVGKTEGKESDLTADIMQVGEFKLEPIEPKESVFTIDSEPFDAYPIHVKVFPDKLKFFTNKETHRVR